MGDKTFVMYSLKLKARFERITDKSEDEAKTDIVLSYFLRHQHGLGASGCDVTSVGLTSVLSEAVKIRYCFLCVWPDVQTTNIKKILHDLIKERFPGINGIKINWPILSPLSRRAGNLTGHRGAAM